MGNVKEYEGLDLVDANECITLLSTEVNSCTDLTVQAVPTCYGVYLNDDLVYSCNMLANAETIYRAILADLAGKVYDRRGVR